MGKEVQLKEHVSDLKDPFQDKDNFAILNDNINNLLDVEMSRAVTDEAIASPWSNLNLEEKEKESTMKIVMPPKIINPIQDEEGRRGCKKPPPPALSSYQFFPCNFH